MRHRQLAKAVGNSYSLSPKRHRVSPRLYLNRLSTFGSLLGNFSQCHVSFHDRRLLDDDLP
jgi:hypothetical protein